MANQDDQPRDERYVAGRKKLRELHPGLADQFPKLLGDFAPDFVRLTTEYCFHDLYSRKKLDPRLRQTATIAALVTQGAGDGIVKNHIEIGRNVGLSREEVVEILMQLSAYAGFPATINAMVLAKAAFDEEDPG